MRNIKDIGLTFKENKPIIIITHVIISLSSKYKRDLKHLLKHYKEQGLRMDSPGSLSALHVTLNMPFAFVQLQFSNLKKIIQLTL